MSYQQMLETRQSCRAYDPARIPSHEALEQLLQAARLAPSACNSQPYHLYIAQGEAARAVGETTRSMGMNAFTAEVPAFFVVAEQPYNASAAVGARMKKQDYRAADIGLAVSQLIYRAHELGLATCILGWFDEKALQRLTGTAERIRLVVAVGYAKEGDALRAKKRKAPEELATWLSQRPEGR